MEFTNLNFITFLIFIFLAWIILYVWFNTFNKQLKFNKKYKLLSTSKYFYIKYIFLILSFFVVLLSIFWVKIWEKTLVNQNNWVDMMFVLDVSKSMNVADISDSRYSYTRLDIAKEAIANFVINHPQDRFWLIVFAWDAVSTIPLTIDHDLFLTILQWVDYRNLVKQWSDFEKALDFWVERFNYSKDRSKVLIFLSDWWDSEDKINKNNINKISKKVKWINYFIVWIWTESWWRIITWRDVFWSINYQRHNWEYVISKLNKSNLQDISSAVDWEYFIAKDVWDLSKMDNEINKLQKKLLDTDINWEKADWWRLLAIIWFILFLIFMIMYLGTSAKYTFRKK